MIFAAPLPFREAVESRQVRQLLPTDFRTKLLQEIAPELRDRAMFSAGVTNVEFLQQASDSIDELLDGKTDRATKRADLKKLLARLEYRPIDGEEGSLTDLSSDRRLNLILDTNLETAQGYGHREQGMIPEVLFQWPAQELIRVTNFEAEAKGTARNWRKRWADAGGTFYGDRMIAKKDDPIWFAISAFGHDYPPFDFNSGMDVQDIDRDEAIALGVIAEDEDVRPRQADFNTDLQASPEVRSGALREALIEQVGAFAQFIGGVLRYTGGNAS